MPRSPWLQILAGLVFGTALSCLLLACGGSALVQCRLDALKALPEDETSITGGDVADTVRKIRACKATADGGVPP
jgi:hypothetical protein